MNDLEKYADRVSEIKIELEDLRNHMLMFSGAGRRGASAGYGMASQVSSKIEALMKEMHYIENNKYEDYLKLQGLIEKRKKLNSIQFIQKGKLDKEIEEVRSGLKK